MAALLRDRATGAVEARYRSLVSDCLAHTESPPDPFEERLTRALPRLRTHLAGRRLRVSGVEPDDLAQEVVARALRYRRSYDDSRSLWPWLRRLAERVVSDQRQAGTRRPEAGLEDEPVAAEEQSSLDLRDEVELLLAQLAPRERDVLVRFHQRGQSVRHIAAETGLPEGTVKSHLSRARRRLAESPGGREADQKP